MRPRKMPVVMVVVAVILVLTVVFGGVLVGLSGPSVSARQSAFVPSPVSQPIASTSAAQGAGAFFGFGGSQSSGSPGVPYGAGAVATTVVAGATTAVTSTVTMTAPAPPSTRLIQPNQQESQPVSQSSGAPVSTVTSTNASRDIEFFTNLTLQAQSAASAFADAVSIAYSVGGYIAFSTETNSTALVEMRIPAAGYEGALAQVESLGSLVSLRSSSNDVTVQYTDLNATLQSLQAEQASLLKILSQSTNINSTLNVESRIQGVDQQINAVQSEILQTRTLISYATISVFIEERAPAQPLSIKVTSTPKSGDSPLSVTFNAVTKGGNQPYIVNYNFGDGSSYEGQALIHTFQQAGHYNVTVTATDSSANVTEAWTMVKVSAPPATSTFGGFPSYIGGLFLQVVEGIAEVAVVVLPIAAVLLIVLFPLRHRLGLSSREARRSDAVDDGDPRQAK